MNVYCALDLLKREMGRPAATTTDDATLLRMLVSASRAIDDVCGRRFYSSIGTRYFTGNGRAKLWLPSWTGELISVTGLTVDDGADNVYNLTLVQDTDYWLYPSQVDNEPYTAIELMPSGTQLSRWPRASRSVRIVGKFGYSEETEATGLTVQGGGVNASVTSITLSATAVDIIGAGSTIIAGTEQMYVSAVATTVLTVVRGVNGTTAAAQAAGVAVTRRRFPRLIEEVCAQEAARLARDVQTGATGRDDAEFRPPSSLRARLAPYRAWQVG